jgi:hypothetical protein
LFRDVSRYSFDNYRRELAADLTLADLERFTERFLGGHRRQLQRKEPFVEFIVPDVLHSAGLPNRYRQATFNRDLAIARSDAEFLALGHPFVDAMLAHVGSYDFGGLTAVRHIAEPRLAGRSGHLFLFLVRQRIAHPSGDECLFQFHPVFIRADGQIDEEAVGPAVQRSSHDTNSLPVETADVVAAFRVAKQHLENQTAVWSWEDDVEFMGLSWVHFH